MEAIANLKNRICVLVDPKTKHIDYIPMNAIHVTKDLTIEDIFKEYESLKKEFNTFSKSFSSKLKHAVEDLKKEMNSIKLDTETKYARILSLNNILEGQIKVLSSNQSRLGECYNTLHEAFKKQTAHTLASTLNLEYAVKLLGGRL